MSKAFVILVSSIVILALAFESRAQETQVLPEGCVCAATDELDPVCGNNGVTYPNLATLRCANECVKYSIHHMHHGPCRT
ncbi:turripeptide Ici9.2 [Nasonia vitripennis]|uniref:Kazal-like domain-containing protein n=1 Tax=Nasonia vitripennis TaxID=7425 RepID=A0A7M7QY79_NASVI|nr:turripeptide Ici9.2 [Nasonia vitripennis]